MRRPVRSAYTLLEVLLALAMAVMLLGAVYSVIGYQLRQVQAGRDLIDRTTLARSLLNRITYDITTTISLADAGRYRRKPTQDPSGADASAGDTSSTTGGMTTSGSASGTSAGLVGILVPDSPHLQEGETGLLFLGDERFKPPPFASRLFRPPRRS